MEKLTQIENFVLVKLQNGAASNTIIVRVSHQLILQHILTFIINAIVKCSIIPLNTSVEIIFIQANFNLILNKLEEKHYSLPDHVMAIKIDLFPYSSSNRSKRAELSNSHCFKYYIRVKYRHGYNH